ncbi:SHOCT domain-containing protein [Paeniglutamicibacter antarcticus]|uniref:SHOCT domain-containing protein n=2 Tax=Arthrobacter terrae TaxID=2935737 RepID=A0A931G3U0_9MICC|nr:SHOCT domain-containing protein [Arthrobacter terrae]
MSEYRRKYDIPADSIVAVGVGGYCAFDGRFVTLQNVGILGRLTIGKGVKRIAVGAITAVQIKPAGPIVNGFIQFTLPGGIEMKSSFMSQTSDAAGDENSMIFVKSHEPAFLAFRDAVEDAIVARSRPTPIAPAEDDVMTSLAKLGQLKEHGILTQEEFDTKKAELLGRI